MGLTFQVADVKKPLISVKRIVQKGNVVHFGPGESDNYISNLKSGEKMILRPNGRGSFIMDVTFKGGKKGEITVDSGAEENVCPWDWGQEFGINQGVKKIRFRGAGGDVIRHWGERKVIVNSSF